ncbi:hypothetical protein EJ08DRAFT_695262 [Tothia fuscella]|uniref:Uncharacterized protein n=1 Tax=Tothia fuscella TaxID=1048955 RepID=A0A9P4NWI5_9PEZI|nr:hypothetical protein EJ08DRAFT_695262 [Tothia fuscella]
MTEGWVSRRLRSPLNEISSSFGLVSSNTESPPAPGNNPGITPLQRFDRLWCLNLPTNVIQQFGVTYHLVSNPLRFVRMTFASFASPTTSTLKDWSPATGTAVSPSKTSGASTSAPAVSGAAVDNTINAAGVGAFNMAAHELFANAA